MGYFDALASSSFKITSIGKIFFPFGVLGRGYAIPTEAQYERLRRQVKTHTFVSLVVVIALMLVHQYLWGIAAATLSIIAYSGWAYIQTRALQPTGERLSYRESLSTQAHLHSKTFLWLMEGMSIVFAATGLIILTIQPDTWPMTLSAFIFFSTSAVIFARMLVLRHELNRREALAAKRVKPKAK
jgi:hypothetical protein